MKKILAILALASLMVLSINAQTAVVTGATVTCPNYLYIGGTSSDTLYASDTLTWVLRVKGDWVQKMQLKLNITKVTGTVSDTVYFYGSFDGTTLDVAIDSIFNSNVATGIKYVTASRWTNFAYPYIIVRNWDKGGARTGVKSVRKLTFICRNY